MWMTPMRRRRLRFVNVLPISSRRFGTGIWGQTMKRFFNEFIVLAPVILIGLAGSLRAADNTDIADPTTAPTNFPRINPDLPTLFIIGDSTVKNGHDNGAGNMWGWGHSIADYFDLSKINLQNRALGGTSSRSYLTSKLWDRVLRDMKPGDFVLMQFGHNDGGAIDKGPKPGRLPRSSMPGNGEETKDITIAQTGEKETVHTYGWYLRKYISDARAKGATPIVCSLIPRNSWKDGKVGRATNGYAKWAAEAARQEGAGFIDLNAITADEYDKEGQEKVTAAYFPSVPEHTHTTQAGAELNARSVISGLKGIKDCPLCKYFTPAAEKISPAPAEEVVQPAK